MDPDPVLRSFLLKLLLKCKASQRVREYLDKIVTQPNVTEADRQQTMVLLMDCHKVCCCDTSRRRLIVGY